MIDVRVAPVPRRRALLTASLVAATAVVLAGCGGSGSSAASGGAVRIGYFPNLTHAPGLVADAEGFFRKRIGEGKVTTQSFNAGPEVIQALFGGSLDIAYLGPNPTITAYARSQGEAIRVISGAASGGASLVVRAGITSAAGLRGKTVASPQLGNTQDVALRYWLKQQGYRTDAEGGGDVKLEPMKNAAALQAFASGQLAGAWVPEPFATQFVDKGATVLVDEKTLWPQRRFVTTNVVVRTEFLQQHPETVRAFLEANLDALDLIAKDPTSAQADVAAKISAITGQETKASTLAKAWKNLTFTADPLPGTLKTSADHADAVGLLKSKPSDGFSGLWDLALLNAALKARGEPEVATS